MCEYLTLVLKLCRKVVAFANEKSALQVLSSIGTMFEGEFSLIEEEMMQCGRIIHQRATYLATKRLLDAESKTVERFRSRSLYNLIYRESYTARSDAQKYRILQQLSPDQGEYVTAWRRQRRKGTNRWIIESQSCLDWKCMQGSAVLCVSGKLGSGKTVAMANIVAEMSMEQPCA